MNQPWTQKLSWGVSQILAFLFFLSSGLDSGSCLSCGPASVLWGPSKISWGGCGSDAEWNNAATLTPSITLGCVPFCTSMRGRGNLCLLRPCSGWVPVLAGWQEDTLTEDCVIKMAHLRTFTAFRLWSSLPCPRNQEPLPACPVPLFCFINNSVFSLQKQYF